MERNGKLFVERKKAPISCTAHSDDILVITSIPPDSSVSIKTEWIAGVNCKEYASAGWYELRLVSDLIYCKNRQRIYSEPVKLHIEDYNDEVNKLAQDWLVNALPHPGVIYYQTVEKLEMGLIYQKYVFKRYNLNLEEKLSEFISKFPTSDFTPGQNFIWCNGNVVLLLLMVK